MLTQENNTCSPFACMVYHLVSVGPKLGWVLSVKEAGRHPSSQSHWPRELGFNWKLESTWEISGDERNTWPMEVRKGVCMSSLALPNIRCPDIKKSVSTKDFERVWTKRKTVGMNVSPSPDVWCSFWAQEPGGPAGISVAPWNQPEDTGELPLDGLWVSQPWKRSSRQKNSRDSVLHGPSWGPPVVREKRSEMEAVVPRPIGRNKAILTAPLPSRDSLRMLGTHLCFQLLFWTSEKAHSLFSYYECR